MPARREPEPGSSSYHHGNLRDALVQAALALEPARGPLGFSLREVARRVGVSHTAVYHHFADKKALVVAVADQGFVELTSDLDAQLRRVADAFVSVVGVGVAYVRFAMRAPSRFRFMYGAAPSPSDPLRTRHDSVLSRFRRAAERCVGEALVTPGDGERAAAQFWSVAHGLASLAISGALDGAPRSNAAKRSRRQRERRALDLVRATMVGMLLGTRPPDSQWRPAPPVLHP